MTASVVDPKLDPASRFPARWPLLLVGGAIFVASALIYYHAYPAEVASPPSPLQAFVIGVYGLLGFAPGLMLMLLLVSWSSVWWFTNAADRLGSRAVRLAGFTVALAVLINLRESQPQAHTGTLGWWIAERLASLLGPTFSTILMAPLAVLALILATDGFFYRYFEGLARPAPDAGREPAPRPAGALDAGVELEVPQVLVALAPTPVPPHDFAAVQAAALASLGDGPPVRSGHPEIGEEGLATTPRGWSRWQRQEPQVVPASDAADVPAGPVADPAIDIPRIHAEPSAFGAEGDVGRAPDDDEFAVAAAALGQNEPVDAPLADLQLEPSAAAEGEESGAMPPEPAATTDENLVAIPSRRGRLAPIHEELGEEPVSEAEPTPPLDDAPLEQADSIPSATVPPESSTHDASATPASADAGDAAEEGLDASGSATADVLLPTDPEPVVAIPRPTEPARQQRLFGGSADEQLVRDAIDLVTVSRRATVTHLQRKLRIDYDQAMELLGLLAQRGVIELGEGQTQGRVLS